MDDIVIKLRLFKGRVLKDELGNIASEHQAMKLMYGRLEWKNFIKNARLLGYTKVEVETAHKIVDGKAEAIEIPEGVTKDVKSIYEVPEKELTPEQRKIKELEEKLEALASGKTEKKSKKADKKAKEDKVLTDGDAEADLEGQPRPDNASLEALREQYVEVVGKKPYHGWDADKIREKIEEHKNQ